MSFVEINSLQKKFGQAVAIKDITLSLERGNQYVVTGVSGSGKSTLLYLLAGLDAPSGGEILVEGEDLARKSDAALAEYRNRRVGLVFQFHFLLGAMSCLDNILLPARIGGMVKKELVGQVQSLASRLGVADCLAKHPFELSGGEQQRINIVRALSLRPDIILCDEPTGNLDSQNSVRVIELIQELAADYGATLLLVTHDELISSRFANRFFICDGELRWP